MRIAPRALNLGALKLALHEEQLVWRRMRLHGLEQSRCRFVSNIAFTPFFEMRVNAPAWVRRIGWILEYVHKEIAALLFEMGMIRKKELDVSPQRRKTAL
jgi:hypothetical protein